MACNTKRNACGGEHPLAERWRENNRRRDKIRIELGRMRALGLLARLRSAALFSQSCFLGAVFGGTMNSGSSGNLVMTGGHQRRSSMACNTRSPLIPPQTTRHCGQWMSST